MTERGILDLTIGSDPAWAAGHFPADPILPGAKLLDLVIESLRESGVLPAGPCQIAQAKFNAGVRPDSTVSVDWSRSGSRIHFECRSGALLVASGQLSAISPDPRIGQP